MKDHIKEYKKRLEGGICEYMKRPISECSAVTVNNMAEAWMTLCDMEHKMGHEDHFSVKDAENWTDHMINDDGTMGAHWTMADTTAVAESIGVKFDHVSDWCWWVTMNMMYSDYCSVAQKFGVDTPEFFADMAKAFLFDKDGPAPDCKLGAYYHGIVEHE